MNGRDQVQDLVVLFNQDCTAVKQEMTLADFERLRRREVQMPARAGESVHAAYVTVGARLRVDGLAFFFLPLDGSGSVPAAFNIPFLYLVEYAGTRTDLGIGPARVASRAQCPVPWVALKLWEPEVAETGEGPARLIQRTVLLNRLGLRSAPVFAQDQPIADADADAESNPAGRRSVDEPVPVAETGGSELVRRPRRAASRRDPAGQPDPIYSDQLRKFRAEVVSLKAALKAERERNRRLQALLRGEV